MVMNTSERVLVIILSAFLALFLLLAIMTVVEILVLLHKFHRLMDKAEKAVSSAEAAAMALRKIAGPVGLLRFAKTFAESFVHKQQSKE